MLIKQTKIMTEAERLAAENSNNQYLQALSYVAVGTIYPFAGTKAPDTFMICNGASLDTTEYAELFAVIGYTFGGSADTFKLPDLRGKTLVGLKSGDTDFGALGKSGGEKTHKITSSEMPSHTHSVIKAFGTTELNTTFQPDWAVKLKLDAVENVKENPKTGSTAGIGFTGGNTAHNNLQPYTVVNYIIKVTKGIPNLEINLPIDQEYNAQSANAQSGIAIAQACAKLAPQITLSATHDGVNIRIKTADGQEQNAVVLNGPQGEKGETYVLTDDDKSEIANLVLGSFTDVSEVGV